MLRSVCRVQRVCCAGSTLQCGAGVGAGRQQKASGWKKGKVRGPSAAEENQRTNLYDLYLRCVEPPPREVEPLSQEELDRGAQLAKQYTRMMWKRTKLRDQDYNNKIRLKWAAIHALPTEELRLEALRVTDFVVPQRKRVAAWTPPEAAPGSNGRFGEYVIDEDTIRAQEQDHEGVEYLQAEGGDGTL